MIEVNLSSDVKNYTNILIFQYKLDEVRMVFNPNVKFTLNESVIKDLMNLCMKTLRDIKDKKNEKIESDSKRIRFIGVEYD